LQIVYDKQRNQSIVPVLLAKWELECSKSLKAIIKKEFVSLQTWGL